MLVIALMLGACARSPDGIAARAGVVEAPMIPADASAAAIALVNDPARRTPAAPESAELPFKPGDRWLGYYQCNQGKTDLVLLFEEVEPKDDGVDVEAVFEFHFDGNGNPGYAPSAGVARMRGTYDVKARRLRLKGEEWIEQPSNYKLASLAGVVNRLGTYSGTVEGPGCTTFSASSESAPDPASPVSPRTIRPH
jgi:hypothetical protein